LNTTYDREYDPLLPSPDIAVDTAVMEKYQQACLTQYIH